MSDAMCTLSTRALVQEMRMNVLANNLANINSVGFKRDIFSVGMPNPGDDRYEAPIPEGRQLPFDVATYVDFSGGQMKPTGNPLDLALDGDGFFSVESPAGTRYTRKGNFTLNGKGEIVTQDGWPVLGKGGNLVVEGTDIRIDEEGNLLVDGNPAGQFQVAQFKHPEVLEKVGDTLFRAAGDVPPDEAKGVAVRQGFLEMSNVDAVKMMAEMIETIRGYESYQKMIQTINEVSTKSAEEVGRLP